MVDEPKQMTLNDWHVWQQTEAPELGEVKRVPLTLNPALVAAMTNGTFTVQNPRTGEHRTFKIKTPREGSNLHGKRIVSLLTGPDNENAYTGFGFVEQLGEGITIKVWRKHEGTVYEKHARLLADLINLGAESWFVKTAGLRVLSSGACAICGRKLTDPTSIDRGIGPECYEKMM